MIVSVNDQIEDCEEELVSSKLNQSKLNIPYYIYNSLFINLV